MGIQFIILVTPLKTYFITNTVLFCPDIVIYQPLNSPPTPTHRNAQPVQGLFLFISLPYHPFIM